MKTVKDSMVLGVYTLVDDLKKATLTPYTEGMISAFEVLLELFKQERNVAALLPEIVYLTERPTNPESYQAGFNHIMFTLLAGFINLDSADLDVLHYADISAST